MYLDFETIRELLHGCSRTEVLPEGIRLLRFSAELEALAGSFFYRKCICAAGIRLAFVSDASAVRLRMTLADPQGLDYLGDVDVAIDRGELRTFPAPAPSHDPGGQEFELAFPLPEGRHEVTLYFSAQRGVTLRECELVGASEVLPVLPGGEPLLFVGDSITQGFFASPGRVWGSLLAARLDADYFNLGIGGGRMPDGGYGRALSEYPGDKIFVAYGVNDCNGNRIPENFRSATRELLEALSSRPGVRIFLLTPIPWPNGAAKGKQGLLDEFRRILTEVGESFSPVTVVDGRRLLSDASENFYDGCHPNNLGMTRMAENLLTALSLSTVKNSF